MSQQEITVSFCKPVPAPEEITGIVLVDPTLCDDPDEHASEQASAHVVQALRAVPDWSISADMLRATYSSDVSEDGIWGALADLAGLDASDLALRWA